MEPRIEISFSPANKGMNVIFLISYADADGVIKIQGNSNVYISDLECIANYIKLLKELYRENGNCQNNIETAKYLTMALVARISSCLVRQRTELIEIIDNDIF